MKQTLMLVVERNVYAIEDDSSCTLHMADALRAFAAHITSQSTPKNGVVSVDNGCRLRWGAEEQETLQ